MMPKEIERWDGFSATNASRIEAKLTYIERNSQKPCPPRGAVPVSKGKVTRHKAGVFLMTWGGPAGMLVQTAVAMVSGIQMFDGFRLRAKQRGWIGCALVFLVFGRCALLPVLADGCFVFRWNKDIDIKEPTQKAIIVHDAGREDLLLQVKYEGPLQEFGWLIPVPSLPTVEKGSMEAFYELSQLTQRQWGGFNRGPTVSAGTKGVGEEAVRVIEVKTVGAYEVAVLSAQDAGSLQRWLNGHDYSIPEGKGGIIDEYIRKGWYFIAAKIDAAKPVGFQWFSGATQTDTSAPPLAGNAIRKQLAAGELHPLRISFDSPKCIYPLRISAVGGKPSEVSLYVLSAEALLNKLIFDKDLGRLHQRVAEQQRIAQEWQERELQAVQNNHSMRLASMMYSVASPGDKVWGWARDYSFEDLQALVKESWPDKLPGRLSNPFDALPHELLQCMEVTPEELPASTKDLPRGKGRNWYLTKQVWTFQPEEMHDLEFQPAVAILSATLPDPAGDTAAVVLTQLGDSARSVLIKACQSTNSAERINASSGLPGVRDPRVVEPLLALLKDDLPQVRYNAVMATEVNWDPRFIEPLIALLRDSHPRIRREATVCLDQHEATTRPWIYVALLRDSDPDVQLSALQVLTEVNATALTRAELLRLLASPRLDTVTRALSLLQGERSSRWGFHPPVSRLPFQAPNGTTQNDTNRLSSAEAAALTTNRLTMARLMGLKILRQNADAQAVALTLPLLRDTNSIVRNRAYALLQNVSGENIPQDDPAKWDQWWATNKSTFEPRKPIP